MLDFLKTLGHIPDGRRLRLLIVEDVKAAMQFYLIAFRQIRPETFDIETAVTLMEARSILQSVPQDIILLDLGLPDSDGFDTLRQVSEEAPSSAIVVCSGENDLETGIEAMRLGAEDFLVKGEFTNQMLIRTVFHALEGKKLKLSLWEKEATFRAITSAAQDGIVMMDDLGRISFWNASATRILGWTEQEVLGKELHPLLAPDPYLEAHRQKFPLFRKSGHGEAIGRIVQVQARKKDGELVPVELSLSAVQCLGGWHSIGIMRETGRPAAAGTPAGVEARSSIALTSSMEITIQQLDATVRGLQESFAKMKPPTNPDESDCKETIEDARRKVEKLSELMKKLQD